MQLTGGRVLVTDQGNMSGRPLVLTESVKNSPCLAERTQGLGTREGFFNVQGASTRAGDGLGVDKLHNSRCNM